LQDIERKWWYLCGIARKWKKEKEKEKGVVKRNQGQKEMEEEEKKIEEKVGWNVGPTRERKKEMKDVIYIYILVLLEENVKVEAPCILNSSLDLEDNRLDDHSLDPDARSLDMEIACSWSATVWTTGQHHPDAAQNRKEFQRNFGKLIVQLFVRTPYVYRPGGA
jgi:hypothetical protein